MELKHNWHEFRDKVVECSTIYKKMRGVPDNEAMDGDEGEVFCKAVRACIHNIEGNIDDSELNLKLYRIEKQM